MRTSKDTRCVIRNVSFALLRTMLVGVAAFWLLGSSCRTPRLERLAGNRLVLAASGVNNQIDIRMSIDGQVWTDPHPVSVNGALVQGSPWIFFDGTLYHLYWLSGGEVRYATSRNGTQWLGQADPVTRFPAGTAPDFARGGSRTLAIFRESSGRIVALDPSASSTAPRSTVTQSPTRDYSITHGGGRFVVAVANTTGNVEIFQSTDEGTTWTSISTVSTPDSLGVRLNFAGGQFLLAEKPSLNSMNPRCRLFTSPDAITWTEAPNPGCTNRSTALLATVVDGQTLFLENEDNRFLRANRNASGMGDTHVNLVTGRFSIVTGPGPQIASLRLDQVTVNQGSAQDLTVVAVGFRARVGVAGSAHATFSGRLEEFASNVNAGQTVPAPPFVSPFAWLIEPAQRFTEPDGNLDILGAVIVGIDRGACPEGPIRDRVNTVRTILEAELESRIAQARLADLIDAATRQRVLTELQDAVKRRLGGNPSSPPVSLFEDAGTSIVCGFNQDEQFRERAIVLLGSDLAPDDTQNSIFNFLSWNQSFNITTSSVDNSKLWTIRGTRLLLPL